MHTFLVDWARRALSSIVKYVDRHNALPSDCSNTAQPTLKTPGKQDSVKTTTNEEWEHAAVAQKEQTHLADLHVPISLSCLTYGCHKGTSSFSDCDSPWAIQAFRASTPDLDPLPQASCGTVELELCPIYSVNRHKEKNTPAKFEVALGRGLLCSQGNVNAMDQLAVFPDNAKDFVIYDNAVFEFSPDLPTKWDDELMEVRTWDNPLFAFIVDDVKKDEVSEKMSQQCDFESHISDLMVDNELYAGDCTTVDECTSTFMTSNPLFEDDDIDNSSVVDDVVDCGLQCAMHNLSALPTGLLSTDSCTAIASIDDLGMGSSCLELSDQFSAAEFIAVNSVLADSNKTGDELDSNANDASSVQSNTEDHSNIGISTIDANSMPPEKVIDERSRTLNNEKGANKLNKKGKEPKFLGFFRKFARTNASVGTMKNQGSKGSHKPTYENCLNPSWVRTEYSLFWDAKNAIRVDCRM